MARTESKGNPQAIGIEKSVLASCLVMPDVTDEVVENLDKIIFYRTSHQIYFEAIKTLHSQNAPIDISSINQYIQDKNLSDRASVTELASLLDEPVSIDLSYHILKLKEKAAMRRGIELCNAGMKRCMDESRDPAETIEFLRESFNALEIDGDPEQYLVPASELAFAASTRYDLTASGQGVEGVKTGFTRIDSMTSGLRTPDITILAARPSMGKTAFALNLAWNSQVPVAIFSLEQSKEQLTDRLVAMRCRINLTKVTNADFTPEEWKKVSGFLGALGEKPIYIDDSSALTVGQIKSRARRLQKTKGIKLVIIDYLQLMKPDFRKDGNRNLEVGKMAQGLKAMGKDLGLPVLCLSQLNRTLENRPNPHKVPKLSDLRDSGEIEQVADGVWFLYRPEVYNDLETMKFDNQANLYISKQRQGPLGMQQLLFFGEWVRFENHYSEEVK
jgi:replicative DNA helicase